MVPDRPIYCPHCHKEECVCPGGFGTTDDDDTEPGEDFPGDAEDEEIDDDADRDD